MCVIFKRNKCWTNRNSFSDFLHSQNTTYTCTCDISKGIFLFHFLSYFMGTDKFSVEPCRMHRLEIWDCIHWCFVHWSDRNTSYISLLFHIFGDAIHWELTKVHVIIIICSVFGKRKQQNLNNNNKNRGVEYNRACRDLALDASINRIYANNMVLNTTIATLPRLYGMSVALELYRETHTFLLWNLSFIIIFRISANAYVYMGPIPYQW